MTIYSEHDILDALSLIKMVCVDNPDCEECPFHNEEEKYPNNCNVSKSTPDMWVLNTSHRWKAFAE